MSTTTSISAHHESQEASLGIFHGHGPENVVAHHFNDLEQQKEAGTLGMWLFLGTEVMFLGAIFVAYFTYRMDPSYFNAFRGASEHLYQSIGGINTAILLSSSFTVVLAVHFARAGNNKGLILSLWLTILLGGAFLGIKAVEYYLDFREHLWAGNPATFHPEGWANDPALLAKGRLFFGFYYSLTGIHALHMVVGLGLFVYMLINAYRGKYTAVKNAEVDICGLYWHFVDIVWIFLFPLLYLVR